MAFDLYWPWIGAVLGLLLLVLLFGTSSFRTPGSASRWHDTAWLAVLAAPVYAIHQFEEHGIDVFGARYAFRGAFCAEFGFPDPTTCPIPISFMTAVNVGAVWGAIALGAVLGRGRPLVALSSYGIPLVNAFTHIAGAVLERAYNPGLFTAVVLFLPAGLWALLESRRHGGGRLGMAAIIGGGLATHAVLLGSLLMYLRGWIGTAALDGLQLLNAFVPITLAFGISRMIERGRDRSSGVTTN